jgi:hypothetical protein
MLDESTGRDRELFRQFCDCRRHGSTSVVAVNDDVMIIDRAGAVLGGEAAQLWDLLDAKVPLDGITGLGSANVEVPLTGTPVNFRGTVVGAIFVGERGSPQLRQLDWRPMARSDRLDQSRSVGTIW